MLNEKEAIKTVDLLFDTVKKLENYVEKLEDIAFSLGAMERAPCFVCGYNGHSYFQPNVHPCAERHHRLFDVTTLRRR